MRNKKAKRIQISVVLGNKKDQQCWRGTILHPAVQEGIGPNYDNDNDHNWYSNNDVEK